MLELALAMFIATMAVSKGTRDVIWAARGKPSPTDERKAKLTDAAARRLNTLKDKKPDAKGRGPLRRYLSALWRDTLADELERWNKGVAKVRRERAEREAGTYQPTGLEKLTAGLRQRAGEGWHKGLQKMKKRREQRRTPDSGAPDAAPEQAAAPAAGQAPDHPPPPLDKKTPPPRPTESTATPQEPAPPAEEVPGTPVGNEPSTGELGAGTPQTAPAPAVQPPAGAADPAGSVPRSSDSDETNSKEDPMNTNLVPGGASNGAPAAANGHSQTVSTGEEGLTGTIEFTGGVATASGRGADYYANDAIRDAAQAADLRRAIAGIEASITHMLQEDVRGRAPSEWTATKEHLATAAARLDRRAQESVGIAEALAAAQQTSKSANTELKKHLQVLDSYAGTGFDAGSKRYVTSNA